MSLDSPKPFLVGFDRERVRAPQPGHAPLPLRLRRPRGRRPPPVLIRGAPVTSPVTSPKGFQPYDGMSTARVSLGHVYVLRWCGFYTLYINRSDHRSVTSDILTGATDTEAFRGKKPSITPRVRRSTNQRRV